MPFQQTEPTGEDITIECVDCHQQFLWTAREQDYYFERGLIQPKRCRPCRDANKRKYANR